MTKEKVIEIIRQVIHNPQVSPPPISYEIKDYAEEGYISKYIDVGDFDRYMENLEEAITRRITNE